MIFAKQNSFVFSAELNNSGCDDLQGTVNSINGDTLSTNLIDDYGEFDGVCNINIDDITILVCDSDNEIALKLLENYYKQL